MQKQHDCNGERSEHGDCRQATGQSFWQRLASNRAEKTVDEKAYQWKQRNKPGVK